MPLEIKKDDDGHVVLDGDKPVYIDTETKKETTLDPVALRASVSTLGLEAKENREAKAAAEAKLAEYEGFDMDKAKEALETVGKLGDKELIDAGKVDEVRNQVTQSYETKLSEKDDENAQLKKQLNDNILGGAFTGSKYISDNLAIPADVVRSHFAPHYKVVDGKIEATDGNGNVILSDKNPGKPADFEESIEILVNGYAHKDTLLKPDDQRGSGAKGGEGGKGEGNISRSDFDNLTPMKQREIALDPKRNIVPD